ncbi:hypothetical protein ACFX15_011238 [Malus domestica]
MALAKQIIGSSLIENSEFFSSSSKLFLARASLVPSQRRLVHLRRAQRGPVAAISEDLVKIVPVFSAEKPAKLKVRAVVTVRNKIKEDSNSFGSVLGIPKIPKHFRESRISGFQ